LLSYETKEIEIIKSKNYLKKWYYTLCFKKENSLASLHWYPDLNRSPSLLPFSSRILLIFSHSPDAHHSW
jgi:hypothetical protein